MKRILGALALATLSACGGGGSGSSSAGSTTSTGSTGSTGSTAATYSVAGSVSGLLSGQSVTLTNNGTDAMTVSSNGTVTFATSVAAGTAYAVAVKTDPVTQTCTVSNGTSSGIQANVSNISVSCTTSTETVLHAFANGADGASPNSLIVGSDGNFYGTAYAGGNDGNGVVFKTNSTGTLTTFYSLPGDSAGYGPIGLLQASDNSFYVLTNIGGANYNGAIFNLTSGAVESVLYAFAADGGVDGLAQNHAGTMVQVGADIYGIEQTGGPNGSGSGDGMIYKIDSTGTRTTFYAFGATSNDGVTPFALIKGRNGDTNLYGVTNGGGANGYGTIFQIAANGVETVLYSFTTIYTDASYPLTIMQANDGNFYGLSAAGGSGSTACSYLCGGVFKYSPGTNGAAGVETVVHYFANNLNKNVTPTALIQASDGNFYGLTTYDGASNFGTIFSLTPDGTYTLLYSFGSQTNDGNYPDAMVQGTDGHFYGVAQAGGSGYGVVFKY